MPVLCFDCDKLFSTQYNLNRHMRTVHNKEPKSIDYAFDTKYTCVECNVNFKFNSDLRRHLEENHNFENIVNELHFTSYSAFTQWLLEEQNKNKVQYVQSTGKKLSVCEFEKLYFECRRSYRDRKETPLLNRDRKRRLKSQGSCKLTKACVSQLIVKRNKTSDECFVTYYKSHYLHGTDIQHLQISNEDREMIASKLILGVPSKSILHSTRESISEDLKRVDLLTNKDIRNMKIAYKIDLKDGCRHSDDGTSVDIWVKECEMSDNNPVLFYKPQGQKLTGFSDSDFCLIIMNGVQKKILTDFGSKLVTIDGTHGLNAYDFELTTLLTLDENRQGFPVAFMFSNRKDTAIYVTFFSKIKAIVGQIKVGVFMSDITDTYLNAWCLIMGPVGKRLLCAWHVDRAWQSNLTKISNDEKKSWVYKTIKYLQSLLSKDDFERKFNEFLQSLLEDEDTKAFGQYIQTYYLPITKQWAYCYRANCGINTNMHIESFHKTIKYHYLEGKKIKRLDKSIHQLMLFLRDKTVERIIHLKKGKILENAIVSKHRLALTLKCSILQEELNLWVLKNIQSEKVHSVTKLSSIVCCLIKCNFCNICIHSYSCTCSDFVIRTTICKHIHYIVLNKSFNMSDNSDIKEIITSKQHSTEVLQLTSEIITPNNNTNKIKERIKSNCLKLFQSLDNDNLGPQQLKLILENTNTAVALCHIKQKTRFDTKDNSVKEPVNKKITKQLSFFSTKKKKSFKKTPLPKASREDSKVLDEFINNKLISSLDPSNDHKYI